VCNNNKKKQNEICNVVKSELTLTTKVPKFRAYLEETPYTLQTKKQKMSCLPHEISRKRKKMYKVNVCDGRNALREKEI
jgi:hypothetical protein